MNENIIIICGNCGKNEIQYTLQCILLRINIGVRNILGMGLSRRFSGWGFLFIWGLQGS